MNSAYPRKEKGGETSLGKRQGFSAKKRLHTRANYLSFFGKSQRLGLGLCTVFRIPNSYGHFRVGVTLKVKATSVERNRVKRVVRELFRKKAESLGSYDYNVVVSRQPSLGYPFPARFLTSLVEAIAHGFFSSKNS